MFTCAEFCQHKKKLTKLNKVTSPCVQLPCWLSSQWLDLQVKSLHKCPLIKGNIKILPSLLINSLGAAIARLFQVLRKRSLVICLLSPLLFNLWTVSFTGAESWAQQQIVEQKRDGMEAEAHASQKQSGDTIVERQ